MSDHDDIAKLLMAYIPQVRVEMPVNMCRDDDPPGERPTELVWVDDLTPRVKSIMAWLAEHDAEVLGRFAPDTEGSDAGMD